MLTRSALVCLGSIVLALPAQAVESTETPATATESAESGTLAALDKKGGFRDARFGMTAKQIKGLTNPKREAGLTLYTRSADSLEIGAGKAFLIRYGFKDGRLVGVFVDIKGKDNSAAILAAFQAAYGPGDQENRFVQDYKWRGEKVLMHFRNAPGRSDSSVVIADREFVQREAQSESEKANNADL